MGAGHAVGNGAVGTDKVNNIVSVADAIAADFAVAEKDLNAREIGSDDIRVPATKNQNSFVWLNSDIREGESEAGFKSVFISEKPAAQW